MTLKNIFRLSSNNFMPLFDSVNEEANIKGNQAKAKKTQKQKKVDPIESIFFNSMRGELQVKFKSSPKVYTYDCPEPVERRIVALRAKKNYSKVSKILNKLTILQ